MTKILTSQFLVYQEVEKNSKIWNNRIKCTDLLKIIALWEENFEESCFDKYVNLRRRLINRKVKFISLVSF